jgi:hypothetical protein
VWNLSIKVLYTLKESFVLLLATGLTRGFYFIIEVPNDEDIMPILFCWNSARYSHYNDESKVEAETAKLFTAPHP